MKDLPQPPAKLPGGKRPGKVLVVENIYHQRPGYPTRQVEARYSRWLSCDNQWHEDEFYADNNWQQVQTGRLKSVVLMTIQNLEGFDLIRVPSNDLRAEIAARIVEITLVSKGNEGILQTDLSGQLWVRPTENQMLHLSPNTRVFVRCLAAGATARTRATSVPT